ncbi:hypothetical protein [Desulfonatronospira sp.]|uniref:hypothetical protein n=1 Tax=Desulfonatronospira sp. TaxID=1962951 RepID=UPI0025BF3424|nr:hypothetical protein [Desulfonatronospira sp.]
MKNMDKFAENLMDETLKEAADTFFSKRKEIEDDLEFLHRQVEELRNQAKGIEALAARINHLLAGGRTAREFWDASGGSLFADIKPAWEPDVALPRAWTRKGRFVKLIRNLFLQLANRVDVYLYGKYVDDPEVKGKKQLTTNLKSVISLAEDINTSIREINSCNSPDDVMAFARSMDVEGSEKKKFAGGDLTYDFNQDLCYQEVNMQDLGLAEYPELSSDRQAMQKMDALAKDIYSRYKKEINDLLDEIYA